MSTRVVGSQVETILARRHYLKAVGRFFLGRLLRGAMGVIKPNERGDRTLANRLSAEGTLGGHNCQSAPAAVGLDAAIRVSINEFDFSINAAVISANPLLISSTSNDVKSVAYAG